MPTFGTVIQTFDKVIPNESFVYILKSGEAIGFHQNYLYRLWDPQNDDKRTIYSEVVSPRLLIDPPKLTLYKNQYGEWLNWTKMTLNSTPMVSPMIMSLLPSYRNNIIYQFNKIYIPECLYTNEEGVVNIIPRGDGSVFTGLRAPREIDEMDSSKVTIEQFSFNNPLTPFEKRHLMSDLRVHMPDVRWDDILVSIDGKFFPHTRDFSGMSGDDGFHRFIIRDALLSMNIITIDEEAIEGGFRDVFRYNFRNIRFMSWSGVKFSNSPQNATSDDLDIKETWISPSFVETQKISVSLEQTLKIPHQLIYPINVNVNAHFIIREGRILDSSEYYIDPKSPNRIILTKIKNEAESDYRSFIINGDLNPIDSLKMKYSFDQYFLINAYSKDDNKPITIDRDHNCLKNYPYLNEITFSNFDIYDTLIINGYNVSYDWIHNNTISIPPRYSYSNIRGRSNLEKASVYKIRIHDILQ